MFQFQLQSPFFGGCQAISSDFNRPVERLTVQSFRWICCGKAVEIAVDGCVWHFILDICMYAYIYIYICIIYIYTYTYNFMIMYMTFMIIYVLVLGSTVSKVCCDQRP